MVAVRHRAALGESLSGLLVTRSAVGIFALALSALTLASCSESSVDEPAVPGLATARTIVVAAASAPLMVSSGEPAAAPSASIRWRPPVDGEKWLRDHGLDFEAEFSEWLTRPKELERIMRFYSRCQPLSLPAVDVLSCPSTCETAHVPLISEFCWAAILHVHAGRLRTANRFVQNPVPPSDFLDTPGFHLRFRVDGDELVLEDGSLKRCERSLARLRGKMGREPRLRATHAAVQEICGKTGRYRWTGTRFVKVGEVQKPVLGK